MFMLRTKAKRQNTAGRLARKRTVHSHARSKSVAVVHSLRRPRRNRTKVCTRTMRTVLFVTVRVCWRRSTEVKTRHNRSAVSNVLYRRTVKGSVSNGSCLTCFNSTYATLLNRREIKFRQNGADMVSSRIAMARRKPVEGLRKSEFTNSLPNDNGSNSNNQHR